MELRAITYAEFDNHAGPQLRYCFPNGVITKEAFEPVSDLVIMGKHLAERPVSITFEQFKFVSYPVALENQKYDRNTLSFAFGFILSLDASSEYEKVLRNIGSYFRDLEIERGFISTKETAAQLPAILEQIYRDLTTKRFSFIELSIDPPSFLPIKLYRAPVFGRLIQDYEVPIFRQDHIALNTLPWDISFQHLILHIDGINHVRRIVDDAEMDLDFVKRSIALLEYYGAVIISDIFRFSNVYRLRTDIGTAALMNSTVIKDLLNFSYAPDLSGKVQSDAPPDAKELVSFFLKLQQGVTVAQALISMAVSGEKTAYNFLRNVDITRLLAYAQVVGIIQRVYEYPVYIRNAEDKVVHNHFSMTGTMTGADSLMQTPRQRFDSETSLADSSHYAGMQEETPGTVDEDLAVTADRGETTEMLAGDDSTHSGNRAFSRLSHKSKAKSVVGRSFLRESMQLDNAVQFMDGSDCLDSYCCRFQVGFLDVVQHPNIQIIYK